MHNRIDWSSMTPAFSNAGQDIADMWRQLLDQQDNGSIAELRSQISALTNSEYAILAGWSKGYGEFSLSVHTGYTRATIASLTPTILKKMAVETRAMAAAKLLLWRAIGSNTDNPSNGSSHP